MAFEDAKEMKTCACRVSLDGKNGRSSSRQDSGKKKICLCGMDAGLPTHEKSQSLSNKLSDKEKCSGDSQTVQNMNILQTNTNKSESFIWNGESFHANCYIIPQSDEKKKIYLALSNSEIQEILSQREINKSLEEAMDDFQIVLKISRKKKDQSRNRSSKDRPSNDYSSDRQSKDSDASNTRSSKDRSSGDRESQLSRGSQCDHEIKCVGSGDDPYSCGANMPYCVELHSKSSNLKSACKRMIVPEPISTQCYCVKVIPDLFKGVDKELFDLDFIRIKNDLRNGSIVLKLLLLHALRWRFSKCPDNIRYAVMDSYIENDILEIKDETVDALTSQLSVTLSSLLHFLLFPRHKEQLNYLIQQSTARLINAIASLKSGREYLSTEFVLQSLLEMLIEIKSNLQAPDRITEDMIIAALQKLSLKQPNRQFLIHKGLIPLLINNLRENYNKCSVYHLEYTLALLMNLFLHSDGRKQCEPIASDLIVLIMTILTSDLSSVCTPYLYGILYSLLRSQIIFVAAKENGLLRVLQQEHLKRIEASTKQRLYLIQILTHGYPENCTDCEPICDTNDDCEYIEMELDLNDGVLCISSDLPHGEALLKLYQKMDDIQTLKINDIKTMNEDIQTAQSKAQSLSSVKSTNRLETIIEEPSTERREIVVEDTPKVDMNEEYEEQTSIPPSPSTSIGNVITSPTPSATNELICECESTCKMIFTDIYEFIDQAFDKVDSKKLPTDKCEVPEQSSEMIEKTESEKPRKKWKKKSDDKPMSYSKTILEDKIDFKTVYEVPRSTNNHFLYRLYQQKSSVKDPPYALDYYDPSTVYCRQGSSSGSKNKTEKNDCRCCDAKKETVQQISYEREPIERYNYERCETTERNILPQTYCDYGVCFDDQYC